MIHHRLVASLSFLVVLVMSLLTSDFQSVSRVVVKQLSPQKTSTSSSAMDGNTMPNTRPGMKLMNSRPRETLPSSSSPSDDQVRYIYRVDRGLQDGQDLFGSSIFIYTSNPDFYNAWWVIDFASGSDLEGDVNASIARRVHGHFNNSEVSIQNVDNATLQTILGDWRIFLVDYSDLPSLDWIAWRLRFLSQLVGWNRTYLITRGTTMGRRIDARHTPSGVHPRMYDSRFLGHHVNFSETWVGRIVGGVKRLHFSVRDDMLLALKDQVLVYCNETQQCPTDNADWVHDLPRPVDVAHFWNANVTKRAKARALISTTLEKMRLRYPNLTIFTDIVGTQGRQGRQGVHTEYARALLEVKIVVLSQRDRYEDHYRLFEALVSGAMVMTDPALSFPWGVVHNETISVYTSLNEMRSQIIHYLQHDEERWRIAKAGRELALKHHLPRHRWEDLLLNDWNDRDHNGVSILKP